MFKTALLAMLILLATDTFAWAEGDESKTGIGLRVGLGLDPDQFVVGASKPYGKLGGVARFVPSIDAGFGDSVFTLALNGDLLVLNTSLPNSNTDFYLGGGPTIAYYNLDLPDGAQGDDSNWDIGLSVVGGTRIPLGQTRQYTAEVRLGFGDVPELRFLVGISL